MDLTADQKRTVANWIAEGMGISGIQKKLAADLGFNMTYMDVRLLLLDLNLQVREKPTAPTATLKGPSPAAGLLSGSAADLGEEEPAGTAAAVSVEVDRLTKPGSLISGTVRFSDGVKANWFLDQFGRLALDAGQKGYRPAAQDLAEFQEELRRILAERGY